jgi:hypothetical protein
MDSCGSGIEYFRPDQSETGARQKIFLELKPDQVGIRKNAKIPAEIASFIHVDSKSKVNERKYGIGYLKNMSLLYEVIRQNGYILISI